MKPNHVAGPLDELIDADLPAEERDRLARVDALLRAVAARERDECQISTRRDVAASEGS